MAFSLTAAYTVTSPICTDCCSWQSRKDWRRYYVHCFLDGRDTPPTSGKGFVQALYDEMEKIGVGKIATVMGRYYAMDRDNRWDRVELAYNAMVKGEGAESRVRRLRSTEFL